MPPSKMEIWHGCFKAFEVDAPIWELTPGLTFLCRADARNVSQRISEPTAEDIAFVPWHLQRFLDGIGEAVACKSEVLKHAKSRVVNDLVSIILHKIREPTLRGRHQQFRLSGI